MPSPLHGGYINKQVPEIGIKCYFKHRNNGSEVYFLRRLKNRQSPAEMAEEFNILLTRHHYVCVYRP